MQSDCVFCKIVAGEIPTHKVYEDDDFFAFLDKNPISKGHVLVIPKKHYRWVWDIPEFGKYFETVKKITLVILKTFNASLVHYITIGEAVPHAHVHIIPRYADDGLGIVPDLDKYQNFSNAEMDEIAGKIRTAI